MPSNRAAWLVTKDSKTLEVKSAPYTSPGMNQIVVKNRAVAVNPVDWIKVMAGGMMFGWLKYPMIPGYDVAGEVVEVGMGVTRCSPGDRVVANAVGWDKRSNVASENAFQEYTVARTNLASPIPDSLPYENASVLPLGLSTAACALFMKDFLALQHPKSQGMATATGETLLVWGGSTSVGCNAIQLARAAGYEVVTTASPKNFDLVKRLGASAAFDYRSATVVQDLIAELKNKTLAGAIAIGSNSTNPCIDIVSASKGRKFIAKASAGSLPDVWPSTVLGTVSFVAGFVSSTLSIMLRSTIKRVSCKFLNGTDLMDNEVGKLIYEDYLPAALAQRTFVAAPEPMVVGHGLGHVQEALDLHRKGVSAKKLVVSL